QGRHDGFRNAVAVILGHVVHGLVAFLPDQSGWPGNPDRRERADVDNARPVAFHGDGTAHEKGSVLTDDHSGNFFLAECVGCNSARSGEARAVVALGAWRETEESAAIVVSHVTVARNFFLGVPSRASP